MNNYLDMIPNFVPPAERDAFREFLEEVDAVVARIHDHDGYHGLRSSQVVALAYVLWRKDRPQ